MNYQIPEILYNTLKTVGLEDKDIKGASRDSHKALLAVLNKDGHKIGYIVLEFDYDADEVTGNPTNQDDTKYFFVKKLDEALELFNK